MTRRHRFPPWSMIPTAVGLAFLTGCGGGGGGGGGATPQARLLARGGDSTGNNASGAGTIAIRGSAGIRAGGASTVPFALPPVPAPDPSAVVIGTAGFPDFASLDGSAVDQNPGGNAVMIAGDIVVPAGATFRIEGPVGIVRSVQAGGAIFVDGEIVADDPAGPGGGRLSLVAATAVVVSGRLAAKGETSGAGGNISVETRLAILGSGAVIDASGGPGSAAGAGGAGGQVVIEGQGGTAPLGVIASSGSRIDVRGGDGAPGGQGGLLSVDFRSLVAPLAIAADLIASGGAGLGAGGGGGGGSVLVASDGGIAIASTVDASAGSGAGVAAGPGGILTIGLPTSPGDVTLLGTTVIVDLRGGTSGGLAFDTDNPGKGGNLSVQAVGGNVSWTGDIRCEAGGGNDDAQGGVASLRALGDIEVVGDVTAFGAPDPVDPGGLGGVLDVRADDGAIRFFGDVDLRGGDGASATQGGVFAMRTDNDGDDVAGPLFYQGAVDVSGGDALQAGVGALAGVVDLSGDANDNDQPPGATGALGPGTRIRALGGVGIPSPGADGADGTVVLRAAGSFDVAGALIEAGTLVVD